MKMAIKCIRNGIYVDDLGIAESTTFMGFVNSTFEMIESVKIGKDLIAEFDTDLSGGPLYPNAALVIKPPSTEKLQGMTAPGETCQLSYWGINQSDLFKEYTGAYGPVYLSVKDMSDRGEAVAQSQKFKNRYQSMQSKVKDADEVGLIVSNRNARNFRELFSNNGGMVCNRRDGDILSPTDPVRVFFRNLLDLLDDEKLNVKPDSLKKDGRGPAVIYIFFPNCQFPSNFKCEGLQNQIIDGAGRFHYDGADQEIEIALIHEMIHAYYYVKGEADPVEGNVDVDEKRVVGLGEYKKRKYSENAFRYVLKRPLRTHYHGKWRDDTVTSCSFDGR